MSKAQARRDAIKAYWDREPWPCILLSVDPGKVAGATILKSEPYRGITSLYSGCIDIYADRSIEDSLHMAIETTEQMYGMYLILVVETWGAGGIRGINQWIGLGEARGVWKREFKLRCKEFGIKNKIVQINMNTWRSRIIGSAGVRENGKFRHYTTEEWKDEAHKAALEFFPNQWIPPPDAAESACMGAYAARSDVVGSIIPQTVLNRYGLIYNPVEKK